MTRSFILLLAIFCPALVEADQITMKNGDRLTGAIVKFDGKNITIKSEYAGPVTLPWDAVTAITSSAPLNFGLGDGQLVVGSVTTTAAGKLEIQTKDAGAVSAAKEAVKFIRSNEEQAAYQANLDRYEHPGLIDLWAGFVDLGYAKTEGNSDTNSLTVSVNATRATSRDKIGVYFTSLYASNTTAGKSLITADAIRGGINYNLDLRPKLFAFGSVDMEFDQFQDLDLRFAPAAGFGFHAFKNEKTVFDAFGGGSLNREFFSTGLRRTSGEILLGEELVQKFSAATSLHEKLTFYPNITRSGEYRINFDTSAVTALKKWLAWQVTISDRFLSDPVAGRRKNDFLFTTGLRLTFAR